MAKYNGHKNWNHWNVSLWIGNDEGLYRLALDCIQRDAAARAMLDMLPTQTPDGAPYSFSTVRAALAGLS